jgi:hypothetical protein
MPAMTLELDLEAFSPSPECEVVSEFLLSEKHLASRTGVETRVAAVKETQITVNH